MRLLFEFDGTEQNSGRTMFKSLKICEAAILIRFLNALLKNLSKTLFAKNTNILKN